MQTCFTFNFVLFLLLQIHFTQNTSGCQSATESLKFLKKAQNMIKQITVTNCLKFTNFVNNCR